MLKWVLVSFFNFFMFFVGLNGECVIEENSRVFVPVCDVKTIFPEIENPKVDNFQYLFRLSGTNLELLQTLDRENLIANQKCDLQKLSDFNSIGQCILILELSGTGPKFYQLSILVSDVNDNVPSFDRLLYNIKISENSPPNLEVDLPHARDPDKGENGSVSYYLQKSPSSHKFILLNPSSNRAPDSNLKLKILQPFDREVEEDVQLVMIAKDQGRPSLSSSLTIKIEITDVNDHAPEFNQSAYRFNIPESIMQGQPIGRVFAFDRDVSSRIMIMISPSASSQIMDRFVVASDGIISTKMALEYSSTNYDFRIPVIAIDEGSPALTATTTVYVHITDVNDNSPSIEVTSSNTNNRLILTENCAPNTYIAKITAKDKDYGLNGQVECKLDNNHLFNLEHIRNLENRIYYKLVTAPLSSFDREVKDNHVLTIICYDKGIPPLTSTRPVTILIKDQNDNPPVFPVQHLTVNILENQPSGTKLTMLKAKDADFGVNSQTQYKLSDEVSAQFNIDSYTGVITTRCSFDREVMSSMTIRATAYDSILPSLNSNITIQVNILDENDNAPRFMRGLTFRVKENKEGFIGRVEAVDDDEGRNKEIEYFLIFPSDTFQVTKTGEIIIIKKGNLDREKNDHYSLEVGAKDKGQRPLSSSIIVEIIVEDENDNAPIFHIPQPGYHLNLSVSTPPGTRIYTAEATDKDIGENGKIEYSIRHVGFFIINSSDGGIFLNKTLTNEVEFQIKLVIIAKDCGSPPLSAMSSLMLNYVHNGISKPAQPDKKVEPRITSSRDLILSLGIGMVLLIFTCLMMLVTYFCVSIFIQKRRQQAEHEDKGQRRQHWLSFCCLRKDVGNNNQNMVHDDKARNFQSNATMDREENYPMCFNRWDKSRDHLADEDALYSYREFTMRPLVKSNQSPQIYDRLTSLPQSTNPYWQYNTMGHLHRPSYPPESLQDHTLPEVIYHHGMTYIPRKSHPDIIDSNSSDEVNKMIYGELSPSVLQSPLKLSTFPQPNYENDKLKYESDNNLSSVEMLGHQNDVDNQTTARFAGYVVGSPCYANSFV